MSWKRVVRVGLVVLAVVSSAVVAGGSVGTAGTAVILAGDDEPTHPKGG